MKSYSANFYRAQVMASAKSAAHTVPELLKWISPRSVVDIGCGTGTWLREFQNCGVRDVLGIDGDYVDRGLLAIDPAHFRPQDLTQRMTMGRRFDVAVSLEVAEHLPTERGSSFVEDLCLLAPLVLFSAAIPGQGGTNHVNEQWQSYWAALFDQRGYQAMDVLRQPLWHDPEVEFWYSQNMILYASEDALKANAALAAKGRGKLLDIVHPRLFAATSNRRPSASWLTQKLFRLAPM